MYLESRKVLIFSVLLFLFVSVCFRACSEAQNESRVVSSGSRRRQLEDEEEMEYKPLKKKTTNQSTKNLIKIVKSSNTLSSKNQTKTNKYNGVSTKNQTKIKSNTLSNKNQTKTVKSNDISTKNQTKTIKSDNIPSKNQMKQTTTDTGLKKKVNSTTTAFKNKMNSTTSTASKVKKLNSTSKATTATSTTSKKSLDLTKASNKTTKVTNTNKDKDKNKQTKTTTATKALDQTPAKPSKKPTNRSPPTSWIYEEDDDDLVSEIADLPNRFHKTLIPDLERISTTSRAYITKANNEITKGFKPYVGKKYASIVAAIISCAFILIPLLLVSLLCSRIKAYFSLQKIIIFIQVYLSIYFTILCISSLVTGLEPLKFLYTTSQSTYLCLQVLQTLAYVFYLLMLLMYLVLVFSTECGLGSKFLGLGQTFVGFAIGLHYYVTVFHRVVLRQPPKTNWKVHVIYATCFLLICVFARTHKMKKAYVEDGGGEGKQN